MSKPSKPRPDFPLWPNPNGQWCKKHKGTPYYFGPWNEPEKAEARYKLWEDAGRPSQVPQIDNVAVEPNQTKSARPKPRKGFPLWPHPNGQWAKKIEGHIRYFGTWDDPDVALEEYHKYLTSQQAPSPIGPLTLADMVNYFLAEKKQAIPLGAFYDEDNFDEEEVDVARLNTGVNFVRDRLFKHTEVQADAEDDAAEVAQEQG